MAGRKKTWLLAFLMHLIATGFALAQHQDFSDANFTQELHVIRQWQFYADTLISPLALTSNTLKGKTITLPHYWIEEPDGKSTGVGTYHTRVLLPHDAAGLMLQIPFIRCAGKVFLNGTLAGELGVTALPPKYESELGSLMLNLPPIEVVDVVIQIANYDHIGGGLNSRIAIGTTAVAISKLKVKAGTEIFILGCIAAIIIYLVVMYTFYRRGFSFLMLAFICLAVGLRTLSTESGSLFITMLVSQPNWAIWKKVEFASVYSVIAFFPLYVSSVFSLEANRKFTWILVSISVLLCIITFSTDHFVFARLLDVGHVGLLAAFIYGAFVITKALKRKKNDAKVLLIGLVTAFPFIFLEILKNSAFQIQIPINNLVEFGVLTFLFFQVYLLATHYSLNYKILEQRVKQKTDELAQANDMQRKLLGILSHDVRGPVTSVKTMLGMFTQGMLTEEEFLPMAKKSEAEIGQTTLLIENILKWVRAQFEGISVKLEVFNLSKYIEGLAEVYYPQASAKRLVIEVGIDPALRVHTDKEVVSLAFRNLFANAIKYSNPGGHIWITAKVIDTQVVLSIRDQGNGMEQSRIFEILGAKLPVKSQFGTKNEKGTGLGILLCRQYLKYINSDIEIASEPGLGTQVSFRMGK